MGNYKTDATGSKSVIIFLMTITQWGRPKGTYAHRVGPWAKQGSKKRKTSHIHKREGVGESKAL